MEQKAKKPPVQVMRSKGSDGDWGWWKCECGKARPIEDYTPPPNSKTDPSFLERTCNVCGCSIDLDESIES